MPIRPNKPIMFALPHTNAEVEKALPNFRKAIEGKKRLFVEMAHFEPISNWGDFALFVNEAHKLGVEIVYLDKSERQASKHQRLRAPLTEMLFDQLRNHKWPFSIAYRRYLNLDLREKKWERMLKGTTSRDVIVMHTEHAKAMIQRLKIPQSNIAFFAPSNAGDFSEPRRMASEERRQIEALRIAKRLAKSRNRLNSKQRRLKARRIP